VLRNRRSTLEWTFFSPPLGFRRADLRVTVRIWDCPGTGLALGCCARWPMWPPIANHRPGFLVFENSTSILSGENYRGVVTRWLAFASRIWSRHCGTPRNRKIRRSKTRRSRSSLQEGILVALICGVTSAFFAFALQAGKDQPATARRHARNLDRPAHVPVLLPGRLRTNLSVRLSHLKNRPPINICRPMSARSTRTTAAATRQQSREPQQQQQPARGGPECPVLAYISPSGRDDLYFQFFFYRWRVADGRQYDFASGRCTWRAIFSPQCGWISMNGRDRAGKRTF